VKLRLHGTAAEVAEATRRLLEVTSNVSGGRGAVAVEVLWSNRPLAASLQLAVGADRGAGRWSK
jgi:hypothetical protein